jgi:hypothetical protein
MSSAVNGVPSCQTSPGRSVYTVSMRPSGETRQVSVFSSGRRSVIYGCATPCSSAR